MKKQSSPIQIVRGAGIHLPDVRLLTDREPSPSEAVTATVRDILQRVRKGGHAQVLEFARKFDGLKGPLTISIARRNKLADQASPQVRKALKEAIANVRRFHIRQKEKSWTFIGKDGERLGQIIRPMHRVGIYVPGGAGTYPSTLIMNAVPAQVAGVPSIAMVSPCSNGLNPAVACAARELGVEEIHAVGGAQAIAMLAFGTSKVTRVDKIVGPGNVYAAVAKKEVFGFVDIDMVAGPSEILVLFDDSVPPEWIAADLLSQAEHGSGYEASVGITTSLAAAKAVAQAVAEQVALSPKRKLLETALHRFGRIFVATNWHQATDLANHLAPEHLEIMTRNPRKLLPRIHNAGAVFLGSLSSEPVGDYYAGPNHVLPTSGSARFFSPLGVYDFYKRMSLIEYSEKAMKNHGNAIAALADAEGFVHHAAAVRYRLKKTL